MVSNTSSHMKPKKKTPHLLARADNRKVNRVSSSVTDNHSTGEEENGKSFSNRGKSRGRGGWIFFFSSIDFFVSQIEITYWDWLPFEVQEKITELSLAQQAIDAEKQRLQRNVIKEIQAYGAWKEAWKIKHIQLKAPIISKLWDATSMKNIAPDGSFWATIFQMPCDASSTWNLFYSIGKRFLMIIFYRTTFVNPFI